MNQPTTFPKCSRFRTAFLLATLALALPVATAWAQSEPLRVTAAEADRAAIEKVKPIYPEMARRMRLSGVVELEAVVNEQGKVEDVIVKSGNPVLRMAARDALRQWKFKPFTRNGQPVKAVVAVTFNFVPEG